MKRVFGMGCPAFVFWLFWTPACAENISIVGGNGSDPLGDFISPKTGENAVVTETGQKTVGGDMLLQGGRGGGTLEAKTAAFIESIKSSLSAGDPFPKGGDARFTGGNLSVGGKLSLIGGEIGDDPALPLDPYVYTTGGFAGDASLSAARLSVGGDLVLAGGENKIASAYGGLSYGSAFLTVADSLSVQGNMKLTAGSGVGVIGTSAVITALGDIKDYGAYGFGMAIGGMTQATARTISVGGDLTLTGGSERNGISPEEVTHLYLDKIISRLQSPSPYLTLEYGGFGDLNQTEMFGLLLSAAPVALINAETLAVSGSVSLQAGSGTFPITSSRGRYVSGVGGGSALMAVGSMTVGRDLSILANGSDRAGDARLLVARDLAVGGTMTLKSGSAFGLNGYGVTDSADYYTQMLSQIQNYESYTLGSPGTGGVALASAQNVTIGGDLNIEGGQGYALFVPEERWVEMQAWLLGKGVYNSGARAALQAQDIRVSGSVTLQGGQGVLRATSARGRYASGTDGGQAMISGTNLLVGGDVSLAGGNWKETTDSTDFSWYNASRGGQAMIALDGNFTSLGSVSVQGGNGADSLYNTARGITNFATWMEHAGQASISASDMTIGGNLTLAGGLGQSRFLSNDLLGNYGDMHSAGQALVDATNVTLAGDLKIMGGDGGATADGYRGGRGGMAALNLDGNLTLTGNITLSDGRASGGGAAGGLARLSAQEIIFAGTGARSFTVAQSHETVLAARGLALNDNLTLSLSLNGTDASKTALGTLSFGTNSVLRVSSQNNAHFSFGDLRVAGTGAQLSASNAMFDATTARNATFILPRRLAAGQDAMLTVENSDLSLATVTVGQDKATLGLAEGQRVVLTTLESGALTTANGIDGSVLTTRLGDVFRISADQSSVYLTLETLNSHNLFKSFAQGRLGETRHLNQGAAMIADKGWRVIDQTRQDQNAAESVGLFSFALSDGYTGRSKTGSHVDADGFNLAAGLGARMAEGAVAVDTALFLETGWGSHSAASNLSNLASAHGDGHIRSHGVGLMGRVTFDNSIYLDASLRGGRMQGALSTKDIEADGSISSAKVHNWYYGSHIGVGERFALAPQWDADVSGRLLWTHQQGLTLHVREDSLKQDAIDSVRSRVGARVTYAASDLLSWRVGAGSEYEFSAKASSSYMGYPINAPRLKGHSAFAEIGATLALPQGASLDFGIDGSLGRYQGVGGSLQARIPF